MLEVLEPHTVLFVEQVDVPKAVFHKHAAVQKGVQLAEQLVTLHGAAEPPTENPAKICPNYEREHFELLRQKPANAAQMASPHKKRREHVGGAVHHLLPLIGEIVDQNADNIAFLLPLGLQMSINFCMSFD